MWYLVESFSVEIVPTLRLGLGESFEPVLFKYMTLKTAESLKYVSEYKK